MLQRAAPAYQTGATCFTSAKYWHVIATDHSEATVSNTAIQVHPKALVENGAVIGGGTRVWAFAHILPGARIGADCNICDHVFIENDVIVGDRVTIKCGVQLWDGARIGDEVFIGPNVTFTNDRFPRSKQYPEQFLQTVVGRGATIGANATVLPGVTIGQDAMIGAGTVVTRDVPPNAIVIGNPGTIAGYVNASQGANLAVPPTPAKDSTGREDLGIGGAALFHLPLVRDLRGNLSVAEIEKDLPFAPKRCFWVFGVPTKEVRGEHAHKTCHQFLICLAGKVNVLIDDGKNRFETVLNRPNLGLHIPPSVWGVQYKYSSDAILLVLASEPYDADDYIRDYQEFINYVGAQRGQPG